MLKLRHIVVASVILEASYLVMCWSAGLGLSILRPGLGGLAYAIAVAMMAALTLAAWFLGVLFARVWPDFWPLQDEEGGKDAP